MNKIYSLVILMFVFASSNATQKLPPLIEAIQVKDNRLFIKPGEEFRQNYLLLPTFFAEYDKDLPLELLDEAVLGIPFLGIAAPAVWASEKKYSIEYIDQDFFYALQNIKKVFKILYPSLSWSGEIIPKHIVKHDPIIVSEQLPGSLFSGGLDAVCTSLAHIDEKQLLITICGSDVRPHQGDMWEQVQRQARQFAHTYGHTNSFIRSNFLTILNIDYLSTLTPEIASWWSHTLQSLSYTTLTAPLLALKGCKTLYIASTRTVEYPYPYGTHPLIDNAIHFAGAQVIHDGAELDRMGKIQLIKKVHEEKKVPLPQLRVCWGKDEQGGNCCECEKCMRTINELMVEGLDPRVLGFPIDQKDLMQLTRNYFNRRISIKGGLCWHWGCIQKRIDELFEQGQDDLFPNSFKAYLQWLASVNPDAIGANREKLIVLEQKKDVLRYLWRCSLDGSVAKVLHFATGA